MLTAESSWLKAGGAALKPQLPKNPRQRIDGSEGENTLCSSNNSIHSQLFTYVDMLMDEPLVEMISPRPPPRPGPCGPEPTTSKSFDSGRHRRITFIGRRVLVFQNPKPYGDCDATFRRLDVGKDHRLVEVFFGGRCPGLWALSHEPWAKKTRRLAATRRL